MFAKLSRSTDGGRSFTALKGAPGDAALGSDIEGPNALDLIAEEFDANGRVTGFRQLAWPAEQTLLPQAALPFQIEVMPQGLGTVRVETAAQGQTIH